MLMTFSAVMTSGVDIQENTSFHLIALTLMFVMIFRPDQITLIVWDLQI